jgi:hypothetical protein
MRSDSYLVGSWVIVAEEGGLDRLVERGTHLNDLEVIVVASLNPN